MIFFQCY